MRTKTNRRVIGKVMVLGLLLSLMPITNLFQETTNAQISTQVAQPAPSPTPHISDLKVMTWNILGGLGCEENRHMEYVADEVMRHDDIDIIALQEVYREQAAKLAEHLRVRGYGRFLVHFVKTKDCGRRGKDFGIALLSRHVILSYREKPLPQAPEHSPDTGKRCDKGEKRHLAGITIFVRNKFVDVYTTHLTSCGGLEARKEQARAVRQEISRDEKFFERFSPLIFRPILMGDMNSRPSSDAYNKITERFRDAGASDPRSTYHTLNPRIRIDYIFFGKSEFKLDFVGVTSNQKIFSIFKVANPEKLDEKKDAANLPMPDHLPVTAHLSFD